MPLDKLKLIKATINFAVTASTSKIIKEIIQNNTDPVTLADKAQVLVGSVALGGLIADATSKYTDEQVNEIVAKWNEHKNKDINTL